MFRIVCDPSSGIPDMYLTESTIVLLYYSTVKRVLLDLTQSVLLARIFNWHLNSDIYITRVEYFGHLDFAP